MRKTHFSCSVMFAACAWTLGLQVHARGEEPAPRLTRQIEPLIALFPAPGSTVAPATLADSLIDGRARQQLFRLESLLRLYVRAQPDLEKYRLKVKELEDALGDYRFAADSVNFAEARFKAENQTRAPDAARKAEQENILDGLKKKKDTAHNVFTTLVARSTLGTDLPKLRSLVVSRFASWTPSRDLTFVKGELRRVLRRVRDGSYDFNKLEDGIHEFRRRLRWFPILIDSLDGLILLRDDPPGACPVLALEALAGSATAKHRYSNPPLRFPATRPCTISRCLLWQVVQTTNDLGRVNDEAHATMSIAAALDDDIDVSSSNHATPEEVARAKAIRAELFKSKALDALMAQLASCK